MYYVYILRSIPHPTKTYTGYTNNLKQRLTDHNHGESVHTAKYGLWQLDVYVAFREESKAMAFEKYLKSGPGRTLSVRHF